MSKIDNDAKRVANIYMELLVSVSCSLWYILDPLSTALV